MGEHLPYKQRVSGSSPLTSTMKEHKTVGSDLTVFLIKEKEKNHV